MDRPRARAIRSEHMVEHTPAAELVAPAEPASDSTGRPMVRLSHVTKRYGQAIAVDDVSLSIRRGEIFGILGPNGAGKTTTLEMIEGVRAPDSGTIEVDGLNVVRQRRKVQERIGVQL